MNIQKYLQKISIQQIALYGSIVVGVATIGYGVYWLSTDTQLINRQPSLPEYKNQDWPYLDATLSIDQRVEDLLSRMTQAEKIGQLALVEKNSVRNKNDVARYSLGGILSGGGANPKPNTPEAWRAMVATFDTVSRNSRLGIPVLYGVDANHGHGNVFGATLFPHFIGLGATHDPDLVRRIGAITAQELLSTGIHWNFSPSLDVTKDIRWGRVYETFGDNPNTVSELGAAYLEGLQSELSNNAFVIGTAKHYVGNGATGWDTSGNPDFKIDQGTSSIDEATLRADHLPPFIAAIDAGVNSVMVGHLTWNGVEVAANRYLLTDVLKKELGFKGFVVSDWYGVYEIPGGKYQAVITAINAGVDMVMLPYDYKPFTRYMTQALANGEITTERLDDAVRRILRAKFAAGLFDITPTDDSLINDFGSAKHRQVAREAVQKSLVLLKNNQNALPLDTSTSRIVVAGSAAHSLGRQSGGWTIEWQGIDGNWIPGTTILDGIRQAVSSNTTVEYDQAGNFQPSDKRADVGIAVVGEKPYAEGWGDNAHPTLTNDDLLTIQKVRAASEKLIVVIVSGRPLDIKPYQQNWDAIVAAWLPGNEGAGVADVLFGDYPFTGTLPIAWEIN